MRKALLNAIKQMQDGHEAPGLLRDARSNNFPDFICASDYIPDGETPTAYCQRMLTNPNPPKIAAE